jgi:purine-nucleoside phosphorylase
MSKAHQQAQTMTYFDQVSEAAAFLRGKLGSLSPRIGIVLGSGLGAVADAVTQPVTVSYAQIPHFPQSTVEGHSGRIVAGLLGGVPVAVMQGRVHFYEGYSPQQVTFPMRVLGLAGIRFAVLTNAAGGIQEGYQLGQLVALADHINLMGWNPLVGPNEPRFALRPAAGLRFFDMTEPYSRRLRALARDAAAAEGFALGEGRPRPRFAPFAPWAPRWWECPRCPRPLLPGTWASRCSAFPASPTWPRAWARRP